VFSVDHCRLDPWLATERLLDRLTTVHSPCSEPVEDRFFAWHALPLREWFAGMVAARNYLIDRNRCWTGSESFLDVGSGYGTKLALAAEMGWRVQGVERHGPYREVSRRLFPEIPVVVAEAASFGGYSGFDLVYSYRLCVDLEDQRRLTDHIVSEMAPGGLLFLAGGPDPVGLRHVTGQVWVV